MQGFEVRASPLARNHALADLAQALNRAPIYLCGLQTRFELPNRKGAAHTDQELAFLRVVIHLRTLGASEDTLLKMWKLEKKLLQLLNIDTTGSATWFLDSCGQTTHRQRRLLLTNYDLEMDLDNRHLQPGLNFGERKKELFAGKEMGEDALRVLELCLEQRDRIVRDAAAELPHLRATVSWAAALARG